MSDSVVTIEALSGRGEGIARHDGHTLLVPRSLPGETVRLGMGDGNVRLLAIESPSADRIAPFCPHYERCGGCQLQHWRDESCRAWKAGLVAAALRGRGIDAPLPELIDAHGAGRRRVGIHVRRRGDSVSAGYMMARSHQLTDIDRCPVLVPQLERAFAVARAIGARLGDCDVALTATDGGLEASVKAGRDARACELPHLAGLARQLDLARLAVNGEVIVTCAPPAVMMGRARVVLPPGAFLQATAAGEDTLARLVMAGLGRAKIVIDLFCGCGPFTFRIAEQARVAAFDSDRGAIAALAAAVRHTSGLKPVTATVRDLFREPLVPRELNDVDAVVLDPPRAGAEAQARQLARSKVRTVIAVACDPQTLARDAAILAGGGYTLERVTAVDQFRWTSHVETVAVFRKADGRGEARP